MIEVDDYRLSARNPIANVDQRRLEALALQILSDRQLRDGKSQTVARWKGLLAGHEIPAEAWRNFDQYMDEYVFRYVLLAVNSDANYPKVLANILAPPRRWFGMTVPGSRCGDGPETNYAVMPVDANARYEISGRRVEPAPVDIPFSLVGNPSLIMTLNSLQTHAIHFDSDGRFVITIGPDPANGRKNHIQTKPDALFVFARDCRSDWQQIPLSYRIERLDPPTAAPLSVELIADRAARWMFQDVAVHYTLFLNLLRLAPNTITQPYVGGAGQLVLQSLSFGRLKLSDDEAYVLTVGTGGAAFHSVALHDTWSVTLDYGNHTSSMNATQSVANEDGTITYVISLRDPGFHNWLDPVGYREPMMLHRWQGLPRQAGPQGPPTINGKLVKLKDLEKAVPPAMARCSPAERIQQIETRRAGYALRFIDN